MKQHLFLYAFLFLLSTSIAKTNIPETPFSTYVFQSRECKLIEHQQSRIFIPSNTFYLDGKLYDGEVNLKYREFTDQLDIVLNNIPMGYEENGNKHMLESGGMFELYAYGNGKLLSFAPNKKITVQLPKKFYLPGGETYVLDRQNKTWKKKTPFANAPQSNLMPSDNMIDYWGDVTWENEIGIYRSDSIYIIDPVAGTQTLQITNYEGVGKPYYSINVDNMDFYNCDRLLKEDLVPIIADFKLDGFSQKFDSYVYVVYKKRNAVMTYYPSQFAKEFKLLKDEDFTIFSYSSNGKVAVVDKEFLENFKVKDYADKKVVFPMKVFPNAPSSKAELAAITGLN